MPCMPLSLLAMNSKVSSMPRPDCLVALRKVMAAWSADDFSVLLVGEDASERGILAAIGDAHAGLARRALPASAPPTMAASPRI